ncbi:MAG: class I SAM-dependent methyltransferase [Gammaproteobacteria bacterium]|nr:class I SAM-dependent methyltransferase [Gammaproteobacteria bacterium]
MVHQTGAYVHESFNINTKKQGSREKCIRQERINPADVPCHLKIDSELFRIIDYSAIGIAILSGRELIREMRSIPFIYANTTVMKLDLRQIRRDLQGNGKYRIAYEITGEPIDYDRLQGIRAAHRLVQQHKQYVESSAELPARIKARVYEIKDWLEQLMAKTNTMMEEQPYTSQDAVNEFEEAVIQQVADYFADMFPAHMMSFAQEIQGENDSVKKQAIEFMRHKLHNLIYQAPFADRVYSKPLGYAGDFEMMNLIYRSENIGKTLFARCLQRYYINEPSAQAVRNRADYLVDTITRQVKVRSQWQAPIRILSVACGPAMEWQKLIPVLPDDVQLEVDLLDQDQQALLSTQRQLKRLLARYPKAIKFRYLNKAIKNIILRGTEHKNYDLVYSSGLFDYLSDSTSAMAGASLYRCLKPGGKLIIGNFNVGNPNQMVMDYALDWPLIYRSKDDLYSLFKNLEGSILIESEPLGINLFCVITKPT